ncbi:MAG TPA: DUF2341 domain-containing protein, partial [Bacteroidetes bacterium]|nr:DUF2341 domain-containing protein [Bacteroidota bacterium]
MKTTLLSSLLVLFVLVNGTLFGQNTCFSQWRYNATISVNNLNGVPLNDFQVSFTMNTQALIQAGKMNLNGSDIRITGEDCCNPLPYWIQSGLNTPTTKIWVRAPQIVPNGQTQSFTIYYGNTLATTVSNIDSVMFSIGNDSTGAVPAPTGITASSQEYSFPFGVRTVRWRIYSSVAGDIRLKVTNDTNMVTGTSPLFSLGANASYKYIDWEGITDVGGHVGYFSNDPIAMMSSCAPASPCPGGCGDLAYEPGNLGVFGALKQDTCGLVPNFKVWYRRLNFLDPALTSPANELDRMAAFPVNVTGATTFCVGDTAVLTVTAIAAMGYQWYLNGVTIPGETNVVFNARSTGSYYCVASFGTCQTLTSDTVNVAVSTPLLGLGPDSIACTDSGVLLDGGATNVSYAWSSGATTSTYLATMSGVYSVTVTDSSMCTLADTVVLTIQSIPKPVINPSGPINLCQGSTVTLESFDPGWFAYDWNSGGPTSSNITADTAGGYYVTVYDSLNCTGTSDTVFITVVPLPVVNLGSDTTICDADSLVLQAGGPWASVIWPDSSTGTTYTVTAAGGYYLHVWDSIGCMG